MFYVLPAIIFVGFVANVVSIFIFFGKELRKFSSSVYVLAVLFADTGFLVSLLFVWLEVLGYGINHTVGMCQFLVYFTYVCSFLSVWYMVCITVENYITICHPTRIKDMCTQKRARIVTVTLAVGPALLYSITLFANAVRSDPQSGLQRCDIKPDFILMNYIITYIDSILTLLVPSLAMTLLLIAIVIAIFHSLRIKRKRIIKGSKLQKKMDKCPQVRVAKMLFALSVTYLILNIPSHVIRLYYLLRPLDTSSSHQISFTEGMIHHIFLHVSYLSCSIKFFLLYAFSSNFRKRIREFLPCFVYTPVLNGYPSTTVSNV
ncbi:hypothetical protein LOTGIDRAFT_114048 [Lottia gigantea]|uniref:G-protein coupled receptors family 1 profile domain-containing protein n=1 Tax=Lottia gigantea TaxID=225164 RepID=V4AVC7_LOTGI|nr:hypothetical protein LOTGIDRAFT_114048 [Lottia gigantea]ESO98950.1 hypothetical protein LOTGIDRAFT_114048 [Lottia gigantea]